MANQQRDFAANMGKWMFVLVWVIGIVMLTQFFSKILDDKRNPNKSLTTLEMEDGSKQVVLRSSQHGHYIANGKINQQDVVFLVDTGASLVSVPAGVAKRIGLVKGAPMSVMTANGSITTYATLLDSVSLGDIPVENVRAGINPYMQGQEILLGMSFLRDLSVTHENGTLTVRQ